MQQTKGRKKMIREYRQGGIGAVPQEATFYITCDGPDPNDPGYTPTWRFQSMRCVNNHDALSCRMTFENRTGNKSFTEIVPASTEGSYTFRPNQEFYMSDEEWGYRMRFVDA
jgi:hypothetical protein